MTATVKDKLRDAGEKVATVSVESAIAALNDPDALFLDVRDTAELTKEGAIPGALHIPRGSLEFSLDRLQRSQEAGGDGAEKRIIVYCASGLRSLLAAETLRELGIANVANLEGGYKKWRDAGGPIRSESEERSS